MTLLLGRVPGPHWVKVCVRHRLLCRQALLVVVHQELVQKVHGLVRDEVLVLCCYKLQPRLPGVATHHGLEVWIQLYLIGVQIIVQAIRPQHLGNLHELIVVVLAPEEGLSLAEHHPRKHHPNAPHVERVVVVLQIDKELGTLEVLCGHPDIVLLARVVKLGQTPINQSLKKG